MNRSLRRLAARGATYQPSRRAPARSRRSTACRSIPTRIFCSTTWAAWATASLKATHRRARCAPRRFGACGARLGSCTMAARLPSRPRSCATTGRVERRAIVSPRWSQADGIVAGISQLAVAGCLARFEGEDDCRIAKVVSRTVPFGPTDFIGSSGWAIRLSGHSWTRITRSTS